MGKSDHKSAIEQRDVRNIAKESNGLAPTYVC